MIYLLHLGGLVLKKYLPLIGALSIAIGLTACATEQNQLKEESVQHKESNQQGSTYKSEKEINAGDYRLFERNEHSTLVFYDSASYSDNFDGFNFTLNPLSLSNNVEDDTGAPVSSVGLFFDIHNKSKFDFLFDTNAIKITTNQNHPLKIASTNIPIHKKSTFYPNDMLSNKQGGVVAFDYTNKNISSIDWANVSFEISKKDTQGNVLKTKKYNLKFNITNHYKENSHSIKTPSAMPSDINNFIKNYNQFKDINNNLYIFPIKQNHLAIEYLSDDKKTPSISLHQDNELGLNYFTLVLNEEGTKIKQIIFMGLAKEGTSALLGSAGALGISHNKELQNVITEDLVTAVTNNEDYTKNLTIGNYKIHIMYSKETGFTSNISI